MQTFHSISSACRAILKAARFSAFLPGLCLMVLPQGAPVLYAQESLPPPAAAVVFDDERIPAPVPLPVLPPPAAPSEFFASSDARVKAHGGRISLQNLPEGVVPGEADLVRSGQLGSALSPAGPADPAKIGDPAKRKRQEDDNLLFGRAMQKWNEHAYGEAVAMFKEHRQTFADSPWAGEAQLHLGCQSQFSGNWEDARFSFEWILANQPKGSEIWQKAKLRRAVLHYEQGELAQAKALFAELLQTETAWERRTYAHHWLQRLSLLEANQTALRVCGKDSVAFVLEKRGERKKAAKARAGVAPGEKGFSLGELTRFAQASGLKGAMPVKASLEQLRALPTPFVAHYRDQHFVVVSAVRGDGAVRVFDPRLNRETELSGSQFAAQWSRLAVVFAGLPKGVRLASRAEQASEMGGCCGLPALESDLGPQSGKRDCNESQGGAAAYPASPNIEMGTMVAMGLPRWEVNPVNMNVVVQDTPLWANTPVGPALALTITYNSQDSLNQLRPFGNKWTFNYATYAMESPAQGAPGTVMVIMPEGRRDSFTPDGSGGYTAPVGVFNVLTKPNPTTQPYRFDLTLPDGSVYHYGVPAAMGAATSSLLLSIEDRFGNTLTITHDAQGNISSIQDAAGNAFTFSYNSQGKVSRVVDGTGRDATFTYDAAGNLIGQKDMGGLAYSYSYDASVYLRSIGKPSGTWQFLIEPADGINNQNLGYADYTYPPSGGTMWDNARVTVTNPLGYKEEWYYDGYLRAGWHRDHRQYRQAPDKPDECPKTDFTYATVANRGVINSVKFADGATVAIAYDPATRQVSQVTTPEGRVYRWTYNSKGRVLTQTNPANNIVSATYAANGIDLLTVTNALSQLAFSVAYDTANADPRHRRDVLSVTDGLNRITRFTHNANGQPASTTNAAGETYTFEYDAATRRLLRVKEAGSVLLSQSHDAAGRVVSFTDRNGFSQSMTYDGLDRVLRVTYPDGTFEEAQWGCCFLERQTDRLGRSTQYFHDQAARVTVVRDARGVASRFGYDPDGNLIVLTDGNGSVTRWFYDGRDRLLRKRYPDGGLVSCEYDRDDNLVGRTDPRGIRTAYTYDSRGNLTGYAAPGITVGFAYDAASRRTQMTDALGTTTWAYDSAGQVTSSDGPWTSDLMTFGYDALGRLASRSINSTGTLTRSYDAFGRPSSVTNPLGTFTRTYTATASTLLASITQGSGLRTDFTFLPAGQDQRLQSIWHKAAGGATVSKFDYAYNSAGEISQWTQTAGAGAAQRYDFAYDGAGQLLSAALTDTATGTLARSFGYAYDAAGNRTSEVLGTTVNQDSFNASNQLLSRQGGSVLPVRGTANEPLKEATVNGVAARISGGTSFEGTATVTPGGNTLTVTAKDFSGNTSTKQYQVPVANGSSRSLSYDAAGNLTADGLRTLEWDSLNRLVAVNQGTHRSEFAYDGLGRRVKILEKESGVLQSERRYLWDGLQIAEERSEANVVTRRYYDEGAMLYRTDGTLQASYTFARDHLGSVREVCDATGTPQVRYDYDPFGRRTVAWRNGTAPDVEAGFTGHFHHGPTGLALAPYRAYDAELGRWLSRDPIGEEGGVNLYGYVGNTPTRLLDPQGLDWIDSLVGGLPEWALNGVVSTPSVAGIGNFFAGMGDTLSFGLTDLARDGLSVNDGVDKCAGAYKGGVVAGVGVGIALGAAGAARAGAEVALANRGNTVGRWLSQGRYWRLGGSGGKQVPTLRLGIARPPTRFNHIDLTFLGL